MTISLYNTLSGKKEPFVPASPPEVTFYTCGVTTYDYCHMGHARVYVAFDCIRRHLMYRGYDVRYVQNFTDIDDKIIKRARELDEDWRSLTERFVGACLEDLAALYVLPATDYPRATAYISEMHALVSELIKKGFAYVQPQADAVSADQLHGDVYFSVSKAAGYGKLSKKVLEDLVAGSRVEVSELKRDPLDFVLWKSAKPGEPSWESPWGPGRPGWHIECSAMVLSSLGHTIDIHAGGQDLIFPHHENEICQSECATGQPFARYWLHNGFVTIREEKMAKSAGNFFTIRDVLAKYSGEVVRFFLLKTHYRSPLGFSMEGLEEAQQALLRLHQGCRVMQDWSLPVADQAQVCASFCARFDAAMDDDCNTAEAIGVLFEFNKYAQTNQVNASEMVIALAQRLGLFPVQEEETLPAEAASLIQARLHARQQRDYAESDRLREVLLGTFGIMIEDVKDGYRWYRKRS